MSSDKGGRVLITASDCGKEHRRVTRFFCLDRSATARRFPARRVENSEKLQTLEVNFDSETGHELHPVTPQNTFFRQIVSKLSEFNWVIKI